MSQTLAASSGTRTRPRAGQDVARAARGASRAPRPTLRVVAAPSSERSRALFVLTCVALLLGGLISLLLINTALAQGSFHLHDLGAQSRQLSDRTQALQEDIARQASPQRLSARASALGMVPAGSTAFVRLSDGTVLGVAKPAAAPTAPSVTATARTAAPVPTTAPTARSTAGPTGAPTTTTR